MKTNSLIFSIIIIVIVLFGYFLLKKPKAVVPVIPPINTEEEVVSDSLYVQDKNFQFSYPKDLELIAIDENNIQNWRTNTVDKGTLLAQVNISGKLQPNTNLAESKFTIGVTSDKKSSAKCFVAVNGEKFVGEETINGTLYFKFALADAGAGNFYNTTSYRTLHNGQCYVVEYTVHSTNIGAYDPSQGITEFDKDKVTETFEGMVRSFKFLN